MRILNIVLAAGAIMLSTNVTAQLKDEFQKYNWFVTGSVYTEALMNTNGYVEATGKVGGGIWMNQWAGIKLEGAFGNTRLLKDSRGQIFGGQLTYMAHLYGGNHYRAFNLNGTLGIGFYHHRFGDALKYYSYMNVLTGNLGIQAVYNLTPKWNIYLEPGLLIQPKYYDVNDKSKVLPSFYLSAGVSYTFKNMFSRWSKKVKSNTQKISVSELNRMNDQINLMRKQISNLQEELNNAQIIKTNREVILEPIRQSPSVTILFDTMGSFLNASELEKLEDIGIWMQDHSNSITIVAFADSQAKDDAAQRVKTARTDAIRKILTEEFGIDSKRILISTPEKMGYVNKTGQEALIFFMPE